MKKSRFTEVQVAYALRQAEAGTAVTDVCRSLGISEATFYIWKKKYGDLGASEVRRLRQLEEENGVNSRNGKSRTLAEYKWSGGRRKLPQPDTAMEC
jgi:putative transposase